MASQVVLITPHQDVSGLLKATQQKSTSKPLTWKPSLTHKLGPLVIKHTFASTQALPSLSGQVTLLQQLLFVAENINKWN